MLRLLGLLPLMVPYLWAQPLTWKHSSLGPAVRRQDTQVSNILQGRLHSNSISLRSLIGIAAGVPPREVLGPDWMDSAHYAIAAAISDESRLRLRTREPEEARVVDEFRSLLQGELVMRFHLEFHREARDFSQYTLAPASGRQLNVRRSAAGERGRFHVSGTPLVNTHSRLDARGVSFGALAQWMEGRLKNPVAVDPSLPSGLYDFHLEWKTGDETSLREAVENQLGLTLVNEMQRREFVVVDNVEKLDARIGVARIPNLRYDAGSGNREG